MIDPSVVEAVLARARSEVAAGRAWRAKELLRGRITSSPAPIPREWLEFYGELLDSLGDRYDAGKYLFLAGSTGERHAGPIAMFLERNAKATARGLISQFPKAVVNAGVGHLPASTRELLRSRGADPVELSRTEPHPRPPRAEPFKVPAWLTWLWRLFLGFMAIILFLMFRDWLRAG